MPAAHFGIACLAVSRYATLSHEYLVVSGGATAVTIAAGWRYAPGDAGRKRESKLSTGDVRLSPTIPKKILWKTLDKCSVEGQVRRRVRNQDVTVACVAKAGRDPVLALTLARISSKNDVFCDLV